MIARVNLLRAVIIILIGTFLSMYAYSGEEQKKKSPGIDENVEVDEFPIPTNQVTPKYPAAAKTQGITGTVLVKVLVGTDGVPKDARVIRSDAASLDSTARATSLQWRFKPATLKGSPVEVWVVIPFKFALEKDKEPPKQK